MLAIHKMINGEKPSAYLGKVTNRPNVERLMAHPELSAREDTRRDGLPSTFVVIVGLSPGAM